MHALLCNVPSGNRDLAFHMWIRTSADLPHCVADLDDFGRPTSHWPLTALEADPLRGQSTLLSTTVEDTEVVATPASRPSCGARSVADRCAVLAR